MPRNFFSLPVIVLSCMPLASVHGQTPCTEIPTPVLFEPTFPETCCTKTNPDCVGLSHRDPFSAGIWNIQFLSGFQGGSTSNGNNQKLDYLPQSFRLGYMATSVDPDDTSWCRGNLELMLEYHYSPISGTIGSYLTGPSFLMRYNFVQSGCLVVPFLQVGAGVAFTDADKDRNQNLIGDNSLLLGRIDTGFRYMFTECFSVDFEVGYQHLSNLSSSQRNGGNNSLGFAIGVTYFYGRP